MTRPKIILDYGVNHEGDIKKAIKAIEIAVENKVDAIKFQHYNPAELDKPVNYKLTFDEYKSISKKCSQLKIEWGISLFFSTWNDMTFFEEIGVDFFKVAVIQNDGDEIKKIVYSTTKPFVISAEDPLLLEYRNKKYFGLLCRAEYPCYDPPLELIAETGYGYSCHTPGYYMCLAAQAAGAKVIEKHFTLNHFQSNFRDHKHAIDPSELQKWMKIINRKEIK